MQVPVPLRQAPQEPTRLQVAAQVFVNGHIDIAHSEQTDFFWKNFFGFIID
jgi:hypothetical protein